MLTSMSTKSSDKKYSEIMEQFDSLNVSQFELDLGSGQLKYKLKGEDKVYSYTVPNVSLFANEVLGGEDAENYRKKYNTEIQTILCSIILYRYRITASGLI